MDEREEQRSGIPLAKAIEDLRSELLLAIAEGRNQELRFKLKPIELELSVAVTWTGKADAGIKFWVVELGAKGEIEKANHHKLKLTLEAVDRNGGEYLVRDTVDKPPN